MSSTFGTRILTCIIKCRARYETLKKGKTKATGMYEGGSSRPPDGQGDKEGVTPETTRPTPRKRGLAKGKGNQSMIPLLEEGSTQSSGDPARLPPKRSKARGQPQKVSQVHDEMQKTSEDAGSKTVRVQRPTPRKRGEPPRAKSCESPPTMDVFGPEEENNVLV